MVVFCQTLNSNKLATPVSVGIENIDALPEGTRCVIKGYETLKMIGTPPAEIEAAKEEGRNISIPQAGWQIRLYFMATSVVGPSGVNIRKAPNSRDATSHPTAPTP